VADGVIRSSRLVFVHGTRQHDQPESSGVHQAPELDVQRWWRPQWEWIRCGKGSRGGGCRRHRRPRHRHSRRVKL